MIDFPATAMVMAAGLGTRMRPLTLDIPKPLVKVADTTLIDRALDFLAASGVKTAVVNTHYLAPILETHIKTRTAPHVKISYEETVLETGGGIKNALPLLGSAPFFSMNSDTICIDGKTPALARLAEAFDEQMMDALLLVQPVKNAVGYDGTGDFFVNGAGDIRRRGAETSAPYVFTGVQIIHPRLFANAPDGAFSLNVLYNRDIGRIKALVHDGGWLHVGDAAGLAAAETWLQQQ